MNRFAWTQCKRLPRRSRGIDDRRRRDDAPLKPTDHGEIVRS